MMACLLLIVFLTTSLFIQFFRAEAGAPDPGSAIAQTGGMSKDKMTNSVWQPIGMGSSYIPMARKHHTALWTPYGMIVWGGLTGSSGILQDGAIYDPTTDSWKAISSLGAPSHRLYHTAVWTGYEMIVWGGLGGAPGGPSVGPLNSGAKYNPATDTWTPISSDNAPEARYWHTAVWTGSEMIVFGGTPNRWDRYTGARYSPTTDTWATIADADVATARFLHTAIWTGKEMVVWGGFGGVSPALTTGARYNPTANSWVAISAMNAPSSRYYHTAVWTGSKMIIWGGEDFLDQRVYRNTGGVYDLATDTWTSTSLESAPSERTQHTAVWDGQRMIVWGGHKYWPLGDGSFYMPQKDTWEPISTADALLARFGHSAVLGSHAMLIWGGDTSTYYSYSSGGVPTDTGASLKINLGHPIWLPVIYCR